MSPLTDNPFAALTLIAAPAVLTNASSVLALGTSNRFARAIDRSRSLAGLLDSMPDPKDPLIAARMRQLGRAERRALLLVNALTAFYLSLGSFAAASLISVFGSVMITRASAFVSYAILGFAMLVGVVGFSGLVIGSVLLVRETRLAVQNMEEEAALVRKRYPQYLQRTSDIGSDPQ